MSFTFGNPVMLVLLLVPALLLFLVWTRRGGRVAMPFDDRVGATRRARGAVLGFFLRLSESMPALILAVVVMILAGPQSVGAPESKRKLTNIQFCVDVSGSMTASMGEGTRYDASMEAINGFLDYRKGDAFGLTFFGNNVLHWVPLTTDTSAFRCAPPFMDPKSRRLPPWFGGTSIGKALRACRDVLVRRETGDRMIILISDGYSSDLSGGQDEEIARELREDGIVLYGIHVATGSTPDEVINIAIKSGGEFFAAGDPAALDSIFASIDEMEAAEIEKVAGEVMDDFEPWCLLALGLAGLWALLSFFLRPTPW